MSNAYRIYMHKPGVEGESIASAASPQVDMAASTPPSKSQIIALAHAKGLAKRGINTMVQQIRASGNEQLATTLGNVSSGFTFGVLAAKYPPLALVQVGSGLIDQVGVVADRNRENKNREFEREQRGLQLNHHHMGSYYD